MSQLIDNLDNKVRTNVNAISYVEQEKPKTQVDIDLFSPTCSVLDSNIVSLVSQINTIKAEIVVLASNAYSVGCGTTAGQSTVYPARVVAKTPNYASSTYDGNDPYGNTDNTLSSSNIGIGSFMIFNVNDSSQSGLGILYGDIGNCYRTPCTSGVCVSTASSIAVLQSQITTLQSKVNNLIVKGNAVKGERSDYELARYGQNRTVRTLTDKNTQIRTAIQAIKDASADT